MHLHGCTVNLCTALVQWTCMELHGIQVCGVECHELVVSSVHFSSALKTTPSSSGWSRHAPSLQNEITFFPVRCMAFTFQSHEISQVFDAPEFESHDICEVFLRGWVSTSRNSSPTLFARFSRNSSPTIFAMVSTSRKSSPTILARVSTSRNSSPTIFARFSRNSSPTISARFSTRKDKNIPVSSRAPKSVTMLFAVFSSAQMSVTMLFAVFSCTQMSVTMLFAVFSSAQMSVTMLFAVFSCAQGVHGVLRLYYKKSTFQPRKLRVSAAYYVCTTKVDFPATEAPGASVCTTKLDFPATEAPGVPGVLRLCYKSRLSSHGSSGCPRRTTSVLQKSTFQPRKLRGRPWRTTFVRQNSIFQPRKSPAYYVCTTQVEKNMQQHYGFSTATTRKPAEGLRLHVKKRKNTTVLAPRQRRNPQRGYVCMSGNAKTRRFWHRANAETRRGCPRARKKVPNKVLAPRPGDQPQRVVRANQET